MYNFVQIGFLFADFEFRSLRRNLSRPKLPRFSTMFHICLLFNLFPETDSCIFPTSLSTQFFCLINFGCASSLVSKLIFPQLESLFADFWFRSLHGCLWRPKLPRLSVMFRTSSISKLFPKNNMYFPQTCSQPTISAWSLRNEIFGLVLCIERKTNWRFLSKL